MAVRSVATSLPPAASNRSPPRPKTWIFVVFATVGYVLTLKPLDAHIRTANPYAAGWMAALICYPPFILMNYKEDVFSDVYTLAHEAGHSMHTWLSARNQHQDHIL